MMRRFFALVLVVALVGAACSGDIDTAEVVDDATDVAVNLGDAYIGDDEPVESDDLVSEAPTSTETIVISDEPAVRMPVNQGQVEASNWLARTFMDSGSVELVWSPVEGAKTYRLYRVPTADADYDAITAGDLDGAEEIFEGNEYGYIDTDVSAGTFLTYAVVAELDDGRTEPRWTEALTLDDVTPPRQVGDLTAEVTPDGVLLQWSPSTDDVEFASYSVSLVAADGTLRYLGGGADEGQTSFLDTDPIDGINRYVVTAVDFHNNMSAPAEVEAEA